MKGIVLGQFVDLKDWHFGRLTVVERAPDYINPNGSRRVRWACVCSCGKEPIVAARELMSGDTKSCGCYALESKAVRAKTHGLSQTQLYSAWKGIKARCYNTHHKNYADYGGRGIRMCDEWRTDFVSFYNWANTHGFAPGLTVERKDVDGDYCPENCCFATRAAQANNRRNNITLTYNGETHPLAWWAQQSGIKYGTLYHRIKSGMDIQTALTT